MVALILLITSLSGLARFWTDYLWFQSVGFTSVFRGVLLTKVLLAAGLHRPSSSSHVRQPGHRRPGGARRSSLRGAPTSWSCATARSSARTPGSCGSSPPRSSPSWRASAPTGSGTTGICSATTSPSGPPTRSIHKDIGFYVFELPFIKFLLGWTFEALIVVLIVTIVAHYLNGGIQLQGPERRVTSAVKTHLSVLLGVLALIKAVDYYFERLELVLSRDHVVNGATATSVHANKPALTLLIAIAIIAAGLFLYNIRQKGWMLPGGGGGPVGPGRTSWSAPSTRRCTRPCGSARPS